MDRLLADLLREMLDPELHGGGHVLPADIEQSRWRGAVAWQTQPDDPVVALVQFLAQRSQAVRRIRHSVQQQHATDRRFGWQFEAAVPVRFATLRIAGTALAVALECGAGPGLGPRVNLRFELREQPVFQAEVVLEVAHLIGLGRAKLLGQVGSEPGLARRAGAALEKQRGARQDA